MTDHTMKPTAACGSTKWVAETLGMSVRTFYDKRSNLEAERFPKPDPILKLYIKADVKAWIEHRRRIEDPGKVEVQGSQERIKFDAL
tara:strand:+ start:48152 stop:48412 length:261 start_codon:yes stop_codon:yes gene_type:complete